MIALIIFLLMFALMGLGMIHSLIVTLKSDDYRSHKETKNEHLNLILQDITKKSKDTDLSLIFLASPITAPLFFANVLIKENESEKYIAHFENNIRITIDKSKADQLKPGSRVHIVKTQKLYIYHRRWWQEPIFINYFLLSKESRLKDKASELKETYKIV